MPIRACLLSCLFVFGAAVALLRAESGQQPAATAKAFTTRPDESVLLLGDHTVARTSNLTQRFIPAGKHPANPVMSRTENWEGVGPYIWGNRLMQDGTTREFRLWYIA